MVVTCYPCAKIQAQNNETYSITESLPNGYYATVYVEVSNVSARSSIITASKVYDITNSSNEVVASFKLTGTSTYPYNSSVNVLPQHILQKLTIPNGHLATALHPRQVTQR